MICELVRLIWRTDLFSKVDHSFSEVFPFALESLLLFAQELLLFLKLLSFLAQPGFTLQTPDKCHGENETNGQAVREKLKGDHRGSRVSRPGEGRGARTRPHQLKRLRARTLQSAVPTAGNHRLGRLSREDPAKRDADHYKVLAWHNTKVWISQFPNTTPPQPQEQSTSCWENISVTSILPARRGSDTFPAWRGRQEFSQEGRGG